MEKQVVFKTAAFGGFDKKAVMDYVYALTQRSEENMAKLEEQLAQLRQEKEELYQQLENAREEAEQIKSGEKSALAELEGERRRIRELNELIGSQEDEIDRQKQLVAERSRQMDDYIRQNGEVSEKNRELEKHRREVEDASAQIGKLLIEAHADADRIIREAQDKAGAIIAQAKVKADEVLMDSGEQAQRTIAEAGEKARRDTEIAQQAIDSAYEKFSIFRAEISELQKGMLNTLEEIHFKAGGISAAIDAAQKTMHLAEPVVEFYDETAPSEAVEDTDTEEAEADAFFRPDGD